MALELAALLSYLLDERNRVSPLVAGNRAGATPGIYAMFTGEPTVLPSPFREELVSRGHRCLYVGKTSVRRPSLIRRFVRYDLNGEGDSTFFCSMGAVLGYRPRPGSLMGMKDQNNFRFKLADRRDLAAWIERHLLVTWKVTAAGEADELEGPLIQSIRPLLNIRHNPSRLPLLEAVRDECRKIARTAPRSA